MKYKKEIKMIDGIAAKECTACYEFKKFTEYKFHKDGNFGLSYECKDCLRKREEARLGTRPDYWRQHDLKKSFGIILEDYNLMYNNQQGNCLICRKHFDKLFVDHCHETEKIRGLLCRHCNFGIGHFFDSPAIIQQAERYLSDYQHD